MMPVEDIVVAKEPEVFTKKEVKVEHVIEEVDEEEGVS